MALWERLRTLNRAGLAGKLWPGYVFNKWIFRVALFLCLFLAVFTMYLEGFDFSQQIYFKCPEGGPICSNPFFQGNYDLMGNPVEKLCPDDDLCAIETFGPGEYYGKPPGFLMKFFGWIVFFIWSMAFLYNDKRYNPGWWEDEEGGKKKVTRCRR